jgi:tetratricopeptide (TPR) repeat protein
VAVVSVAPGVFAVPNRARYSRSSGTAGSFHDGSAICPTARRERLSSALSEAVAFHEQGNLAEARRLYKLVLREQPDQFDAFHLLRVVEAQRGHPDKAARLLRDALRINPSSAEAHFSRGNALLQLRRPDDALAAFERALELDPDS